MGIRTILVPVSGDAGSDLALDAALLVGRRAGAHVEVLHVAADARDAIPAVGEGATAALAEELVETAARDARLRRERARAAFHSRLAGGCVPRVDGRPSPAEAADRRLSVGWRETVGQEDREVARRGRLFDLVVIGRPGGDDIASEATLEAALIESGRPILVAPPLPVPSIGTRVAIAWNGSTEAARAVAAAAPFLARAEHVAILKGDAAAAGGESADDLAVVLAWRGVFASIHHFRSGSSGIGSALLAAAAGEGADLLVMGGYGHSRMREMIFGGATIDTIFKAKLPLLMTH